MHALALLLGTGPALAADLPAAFSQAASEFGVPEKLLLAIAFEASRWDPDAARAWAGYGLFDLREAPSEGNSGGPDIEACASLLDVSPDDLIADPRQNVRGAAALLATQAKLANDGALPDDDDLIAWWDAVRAFSGRQEPELQAMYAGYVFELINFGVPAQAVDGGSLEIEAEPVDHWGLVPVPPPSSCDYSGCSAFTAACSDNYSDYSRGASDISYIIIHTVQGSYSGCISWFQNCSASVSAHYVVRSSDGAITQMVHESDVAWHAGNWTYNEQSVGIEHEGYVEDPGTWYTTAMYSASAALTADIAARQGVDLDRSHIIGHYEVPGATHTDPGSGWDWDYYMSLVTGGGGGASTGNLIGVVADSDIYNGARLVGATAWIESTGETTSTDDSGYYRFYDLALGTYTVHATASGYAEGTCTKEISTGDNWCSIALTPSGGGGGGDDTGTAGGGDDTGPTGGDTAPPDTGGPPVEGAGTGDDAVGEPPGTAVPLDEVGGCAHGRGAPATGALALSLIAACARRRRRD